MLLQKCWALLTIISVRDPVTTSTICLTCRNTIRAIPYDCPHYACYWWSTPASTMARARCKSGSIYESKHWPYMGIQIIYVAIVGPVMLAAFFEWVLWLVAFLFCLAKVYTKADHWTVRFLAVVMMILFTLLR